MEKIEFKAQFDQSKSIEFQSSKLRFLEMLKRSDGYINFTENTSGFFNLSILWEDKTSLLKFLRSDQFHYFRGAIITLGKSVEVLIDEKQLQMNKNDYQIY
jgi:hypothetical protein